MNEEVLQTLYKNASVHFDMPDFDQFKSDMQDQEKALRFRSSMSEHYEIPDDNKFLSDIGLGGVKKKTTSLWAQPIWTYHRKRLLRIYLQR